MPPPYKYIGGVLASGSAVVFIEDLADFPAPLAGEEGVIRLADETAYMIGTNSVDIGTNRFITGTNTVIRGVNQITSTMIYTGTGDLFTSENTTLSLVDIRVIALTANKVFNFSSPADPVGSLLLASFTMIAPSFGTLDNFFALNMVQVALLGMTSGIVFSGSNAAVALFDSNIVMTTGIFLDLGTATFNLMDYRDNLVTLIGGTFLKGAASSANINTGGFGLLRNTFVNNFGGTILDTVTSGDVLWQVNNFTDLRDSKTIGSFVVTDNSTVTTMTVQDQWEDVNFSGLATIGSNNERFTLFSATTGELTHIGVPEFIGEFIFTAQVDSSGPSQVYELRIVIDGSVTVDAVQMGLEIQSSDMNITFISPAKLDTGQKIRPQVRCRAASPRDITFKNVSVSIK